GIEGCYVQLIDDAPVAVQLPPTVALDVTDTAPELKGATATKRPKPAKLSTGIEILVPEYITTGEKVLVNTTTGEFSGRAYGDLRGSPRKTGTRARSARAPTPPARAAREARGVRGRRAMPNRRLRLALLAALCACPAANAVDYDIVYVRQPRFGDDVNTIWP